MDDLTEEDIRVDLTASEAASKARGAIAVDFPAREG